MRCAALRQDLNKHCTLESLIAAYSLPLLFVWGIILYLGATDGLTFLSETSFNLDPPKTSPSRIAHNRMFDYFPQKT